MGTKKKIKRAYIKCVGGRGGGRAVGGFYKFFQENFAAYEKIVQGPSHQFSFLFKAYLQQYFRVVLTLILKFQIAKEANIHNNIQKIIFK